ncbi:hypothetical protein ACTJI8_20295 [Microbacterium sp. 22303]|uniref:hypothetical protein n=1 Tax=Microbacterium sp. 22303 TaxID=3453905 RepID=UPI003F87A9C0
MRTSAGMWVQQGSPAGSIPATLVYLPAGMLPTEQFMAWGWRVPFLFSAVLLVVALVIRSRVEESKDFVDTKQNQQIVRVPVVRVFRVAPALLFFGVLASAAGIAGAFFQRHVPDLVVEHALVGIWGAQPSLRRAAARSDEFAELEHASARQASARSTSSAVRWH